MLAIHIQLLSFAQHVESRHHFRDGALIWPYGTVSHLPDVNQHYLIYACQVNHTCPSVSRYCVVDHAFDFSFSKSSNCTCSPRRVQLDREEHMPGVIRQKHGCELCLHKALWPPNLEDISGAWLLLASAVLAGAVGIGGGGLIVPILVLSMGFHVKEAVPLSHVGVFGSALAQNIINVPRRHPLTDARPLVDAEIALLLMPCMLLGHSLGVLIGPMLPEEFIEMVAVFVLAFAALKTTRSAYTAFRKEIEAGKRSSLCARSFKSCEGIYPLPGPDPLLLRAPLTAPPTVEHQRSDASSSDRTFSPPSMRSGNSGSDRVLLPPPRPSSPSGSGSFTRKGTSSAPPCCRSIWERLLQPGTPRSDSPTNISPTQTRRAVAAAAAAGELSFLAHAPRMFVREQYHQLSPLGTMNQLSDPSMRRLSNEGTSADGNNGGGEGEEAGAGAPTTANTSPGGTRWRWREYPQPIDGGSVLLLLLTWIFFAAQYRLDMTKWRYAYAGVNQPRCNPDDPRLDCLYRLLPFLSLRVAIYAGILLVVVVSFKMVRRSQQLRHDYGVPVLPGDLVWTLEQTLSTQATTVCLGTVAGLLGLGGSELMAPLLVHLGMLPEVVSAVNAFIIFFTSAADLEHYSDLGVLQLYSDTITRPGYVILLLVGAFGGALIGRVGATRLTAKFAHPSILIFLLGATLFLSAALLVGRVIAREQQEVQLRSHDLTCLY